MFCLCACVCVLACVRSEKKVFGAKKILLAFLFFDFFLLICFNYDFRCLDDRLCARELANSARR